MFRIFVKTKDGALVVNGRLIKGVTQVEETPEVLRLISLGLIARCDAPAVMVDPPVSGPDAPMGAPKKMRRR